MTRTNMKALPQALLATLVVTPLAFAQAPAPAPQKVEKIEVTGSNIKRIDAETPAPVQIITREDIEKSGKLTIGEVLRDLPGNTGNSFNETFTNSFSPGSSGIALRGLGQKATLVLINGRRMANYGFAQNLQDTFVDLNSIPNSAIERVEVLKDGASAIYGADAIAGVVNIILRKDYKGLQWSGSAGTRYEKGMNEYRTSLTAGVGDLARDRYNLLGVIDFYHRDLLTWSETSWLRDGDTRQYPGGTLSGWSGGVATLQLGANPATGFGNRLGLTPCPHGSIRRPASDFDNRRLGDHCALNVAPYLTLFPETDRVGVLVRGSMDFSSNTSGFFEGNYSHNKSFQKFTAAFAPTSQVDQATGLTVTTNIILPATHPNNPTGASRILQYAFYELGGRDADIETKSGRIAAGLKGVVGAWDWEVGVGGAKSKSEQINYNRVNRFLLTQTFVNGYNFATPSAATMNALRITPVRNAESKLTFLDGKISSEIAQLPAGPLGFAAGMEFRRESLADRPDSLITSGAVLGQGGTATDGSRNSNSQFAELSAPLTKTLEAQLAVRRDDYSDFGSKTSPKVGLKWTPMKEFLVRGTWSKAFKAPTLPEVSPSRATFFTVIFDPVNQGFFQIAGTALSNPNLKAETSKNGNFGFVWEPSKDTNFAVDFYRIRLNDTIQLPIQSDFNRVGRGQSIAPNQIIRDSNGFPLAWSGQYLNLDFQETSGIDFEVNHRMPLWNGKFGITASFNYVTKFYVPEEPGGKRTDVVDLNSGDFTSSVPRYKGFVTGSYEKGNWTSAATYRYTHSVDQNAAGAPARLGGTAPENRVGAAYFVDLFAAYNGIKNLRLTANVRNVLNRRPPYDPAYGSGIDFTQYDARGRFYTVGATYTFK